MFKKICRNLATAFRQRGAMAVESLIALPVVSLLMMGGVEWARVYEAKTATDYAVSVAAREASFDAAKVSALQRGLVKGMAPYYSGSNLAQSLNRATAAVAQNTQVRILNPTQEAFSDFGVNKNGGRYLPNDGLHRLSTTPGASSGINIQDANLLKVEVTVGIPMRMPIVGDLITAFGGRYLAANNFERQLYARGMLPVVSSSVTRMHSEAILNDSMVSLAELQGLTRQKDGPKEQLAGNTTSVLDTSPSEGFKGGSEYNWVGVSAPPTNPGSTLPTDHIDQSNNFTSEEATDESKTDETTVTEPVNDGLSCETNWEDPRYKVESDLPWYDPDRWIGAIVAAKNVIQDYAAGLLEGAGNQAQELLDLITNPGILLDLAEAFIKDPPGFLEQLFDGLVEDAETLIKCGPKDIGRIIGENLSPVVLLKIVGKLAKLGGIEGGPLAEYRAKLEKQIECASFPAGTHIATPGGYRSIESLAVGDLVYSRDEVSFADQPQVITQRFNRMAEGYQRIETEFGVITATPEHPFWVQGKGWTEAKDLEWEDPIATRNGDVVAFGNTYVSKSVRVYNFSVANTANYFAGEAEAWVHNADGCLLPESNRSLDELLPNGRVPTVKKGFDAWFDNLSTKELDRLWADNKLRNQIETQIRYPGRLHEWCMACRAPEFKRWGVSIGEIKRFRTSTDDLKWTVPDDVPNIGGRPGGHNGDKTGSTTFHNELKHIIDGSESLDDFNSGVEQLRDRWKIDPSLLPNLPKTGI